MSTELLRHRRAGTRSGARRMTVAIGAVLAVGALITAFPFLWMLTTSLKPQRESIDFPPTVLPQDPTLEWYLSLIHI